MIMSKRRLTVLIYSCLIVLETMLCRPEFMRADTSSAPTSQGTAGEGANGPSPDLATNLGVKFVKGSTSTLILERGGKKYVVNLATQSIAEAPAMTPAQKSGLATGRAAASTIFQHKCSSCHGVGGKGILSNKTPDFTNAKVQASLTDQQMLTVIRNGKKGTMMPAWSGKLPDEDLQALARYIRSLGSSSQSPQTAATTAEGKKKPNIYEPGDDVLFTLPTGRRLKRHGFYVNFAHRFAYDPAFSGTARGGALLGMDGFAIPSFGFRYGVTDKLSVSIFRAPSIIARPIQLMAAYNFLDEHDGAPFNFAARFSVEGENDFAKNYTENFEGIFSRSLTHRAQLYFVPTLSLNDRPLQQVTTYSSRDILDLPGHNALSLGVGGALDIRPTVALVAEVIPTVVNGRPLGIYRPPFAFGVQKKIWRHSFTFGFTTSPGTTVSQRAATRASFLGEPSADTPAGLFVGFDLTRQIF